MKSTPRHALAFAISAGLFAMSTASAATLVPGQSATVAAGDTPEGWTLNEANLQVQPGGQTLSINARNTSRVMLSGAQVTGNTTQGAILLTNSNADIENSVISNTAGRALSLAVGVGNGLAASEATLRGSTLIGLGVGASLSTRDAGQRAILTLDATRVEGLANGAPGLLGGNGVLLFGTADVRASNGSTIVGDRDGIYALETNVDGAANVVIDASRVEGRTGSAIHVGPSRFPHLPPDRRCVHGPEQQPARWRRRQSAVR